MKLTDQNIEIIPKMKILGTIITKNFSWDDNCSSIIKKVNARMQLLQKVWSFGSNMAEMVHLWKVYCLSILMTFRELRRPGNSTSYSRRH